MKIQIKDYLLTPSDNAKERFDLTRKVMRTKKDTGVQYQSDEVLGYGMTLNTCIEDIIAQELDKDGSVVDLRRWVDAYKKEREVIMGLLKQDTIKGFKDLGKNAENDINALNNIFPLKHSK